MRCLPLLGQIISMAHALAHNWQVLAALRGLLGLAEGSANPAGMKATSEWFPAKERGLAGGVYNIGASFGSDARTATRRVGNSAIQLASSLRQ